MNTDFAQWNITDDEKDVIGGYTRDGEITTFTNRKIMLFTPPSQTRQHATVTCIPYSQITGWTLEVPNSSPTNENNLRLKIHLRNGHIELGGKTHQTMPRIISLLAQNVSSTNSKPTAGVTN